MSMTTTDLSNEAVNLLTAVLVKAHNGGNEVPLDEAFIFRHANHVRELGEDVFALDTLGRLSSARIIVRSMMESLFSLAASEKLPEFPAQKIIAESEYAIGNAKKWQKLVTDPAFITEMDAVITNLTAHAIELRAECSVTSKKTWNVFETADAGDLAVQHRSDYFYYSEFVHGTTYGIVGCENKIARGHTIQTATQVILMAAAYVLKTLPLNCAKDPYFKEATRLLTVFAELIKAGEDRRLNRHDSEAKAV